MKKLTYNTLRDHIQSTTDGKWELDGDADGYKLMEKGKTLVAGTLGEIQQYYYGAYSLRFRPRWKLKSCIADMPDEVRTLILKLATEHVERRLKKSEREQILDWYVLYLSEIDEQHYHSDMWRLQMKQQRVREVNAKLSVLYYATVLPLTLTSFDAAHAFFSALDGKDAGRLLYRYGYEAIYIPNDNQN